MDKMQICHFDSNPLKLFFVCWYPHRSTYLEVFSVPRRSSSKETLLARRGLVYPRHGHRPLVDRESTALHAGQLESLLSRPTAVDHVDVDQRLLHCTALHQNSAEGVRISLAIVLDGHLVMTGQLPVTIHDTKAACKDLSTTNLP